MSLEQQQDHYTIQTADSDALIRELVQQQVEFRQLRVNDTSLEKAFLEMNNEGPVK